MHEARLGDIAPPGGRPAEFRVHGYIYYFLLSKKKLKKKGVPATGGERVHLLPNGNPACVFLSFAVHIAVQMIGSRKTD